MCIHGRTGGWRGRADCCGPAGAAGYFGYGYPKREIIRELEEYQKDLEEEVLGVADRIKALKGEA